MTGVTYGSNDGRCRLSPAFAVVACVRALDTVVQIIDICTGGGRSNAMFSILKGSVHWECTARAVDLAKVCLLACSSIYCHGPQVIRIYDLVSVLVKSVGDVPWPGNVLYESIFSSIIS